MITITEVQPIGTRKVVGFWDGRDANDNPIGGYGPVELPAYPEGEAFWKLRVEAGVTPSAIAKRLGISPRVVYGLGFGRHTTDAAGWEALRQAVEELREP